MHVHLLLLIIKLKINIFNDDSYIELEISCGLSTDVDDGGACEGLASEILKAGRACDLFLILITTCTLHDSDRMMQTPCQKFFGDSSLKDINIIKLSCTCCALQESHEIDELKKAMSLCTTHLMVSTGNSACSLGACKNSYTSVSAKNRWIRSCSSWCNECREK